MIIVRSVLFNALFRLNLVLHLLAAVALIAVPGRAMLWLARAWVASTFWLLRVVCGIRIEWSGLARIPQGALIVAAKHQSVLDLLALVAAFPDPAFIVKRELIDLPLLGWCLRKAHAIPIDRGPGGGGALADHVRGALAAGRQIIVFPEGGCRPPGAPPAYDSLVAGLYAGSSARCLPVALNSGLFWPHRSIQRHPGVVRIEILELIEPGLGRDAFMRRLQDATEAATARLVGDRSLPATRA